MSVNIFKHPSIVALANSYHLDSHLGSFRGAYLVPGENYPIIPDHVRSETQDVYRDTCRTLIEQANALPVNSLDRDSDGYILLDDHSWKARLYDRAQTHAPSRLLIEKVEQPDFQKTSLLFLEEPPVSQIVLYQENTRGVVRQTAVFGHNRDVFYQTLVSLYPTKDAFFRRWEKNIAELTAGLYISEMLTEATYEAAIPPYIPSSNESDDLSGGAIISNTQLPLPDLANPGKIVYTPFFRLDFMLQCGTLQYLEILITSTQPTRVPGTLWTEILRYIQGDDKNYGLSPNTSTIE